MTLAITLNELLDWTSEERAKWLSWLKANPGALDVTLQAGGRFPTVNSLIDHIFLIEHRHTLRLQHHEVPTTTGVALGQIDELFAYAAKGRLSLLDFLPTLTADEAALPRDIVVAAGTYSMTPRKLLFHMVLHEVRHWAQIAVTVRAAGFVPPGDHDLFYSKTLT